MIARYIRLGDEPADKPALKSCQFLRQYYHLAFLSGFLLLGLGVTFFSRFGSQLSHPARMQFPRQQPLASTSCGGFLGAWEAGGSVAAFRGIQFGRVGRWLPPDEVCAQPSETLPAIGNGPECLSTFASHEGQSEQCLYLNVFTPRSEAASLRAGRLPIVAYIHGGSLAMGSASTDGHLSKLVSLTGEVVVVSCQYRLGVLGFMALRELSERDPRGASGNYGFLDQQLCLRWIQRHGQAFGGDTSRVTLLGQSAGGTSILAQLLVRGNQGLFHGAIALSPSPGAPRLSQEAKERQDRALWFPQTGCLNAVDIVSCLMSMDAGHLASSLPDSYWILSGTGYPVQPEGHISWTSLSHVDGVTVAAPTDAVYPDRIDVPLLIESMGAESAGKSEIVPAEQEGALLRQFLEKKFSAAFGEGFAAEVEGMYAGGLSRERALYKIDSDIGNLCGLLNVAQAAAATSSSAVYVGVVEAGPGRALYWCDCSRPTQHYPFHGWDLAAATEVWDQLWCTCPNYSYDPTSLDRQFAAQQRRRWLSLAKHGRLDPDDSWTSLKHQSAYGLIAHSNVTMKALPDRRCAFWESHNVSKNWYWIN